MIIPTARYSVPSKWSPVAGIGFNTVSSASRLNTVSWFRS